MGESAPKLGNELDRRRAHRAALRLSATIREGGRSRTRVRLIDISAHGCRIECSSTMAVDSWIWLGIAGLETQYCRVVWHCQEFVGLEFATPLADAVLERLLQEQQNMPETTINELRQIASRTHGLARQASDTDIHPLAELSRQCAVDAVVEGFRISEASGKKSAKPSKQKPTASA
jgi:hypothetical protein